MAIIRITNNLSRSNRISVKIEYMEELEKKEMTQSKLEQLEGSKIIKLNGMGDHKFLN